MKTMNLMKLFGIVALTGALAIGCAEAPKEGEPEPANNSLEDLVKSIEDLKKAEDCKSDASDAKLAEAEKLAKELKFDEAKVAYDEAKAMVDECRAAKNATPTDSITYTVVGGDHLWGISAKDEIYGNAFQWPLIYKANADKINDPDLIKIGQELTVNKGVSEAEVEAAVNHAKTRGSWTVGGIESSDKAYANQ